jgi:hypothetical protein
MRFLLTGLAAATLALPPAVQGLACEGYSASAQATAADLSAATKKKTSKKAVVKKKKEKVEYMRAAPMPPGAK